jgi:hypothetical protein
MSDRDVAQLIRSQEIDILIDLHGLTRGARPDILSLRPAPVQMTWLGLPGTTGHPEIDYVIADDFVLPTELEPYFTEKPLRLPRCFQVNDRQREVGPAPSRASLGLPEDQFVDGRSLADGFHDVGRLQDVLPRHLSPVGDDAFRHRNAGPLHHEFGLVLVHRERRREDARMRVGNAQYLEEALDGPVLADFAMQGIEGGVRHRRLEDEGDIGLHVDWRNPVALPFQGLGAGAAGGKADFALRRPAAVQNRDVLRHLRSPSTMLAVPRCSCRHPLRKCRPA